MINFIILGAQKAATSALQNSLRLQPGISMPKGESAFFEDPEYKSRLWETSENGESPVVKGVKRPDYLCSDQARVRIAEALPDAQFIVVLREPVSRTISSYCYMVRHAHLPALPLNEGLERCLADYHEGRDTRAATVISYGLYGLHLEKWYQAYAKDRFLVLSQQEVGRDLEAALRRCLAHLDVEHSGSQPLRLAKGDSNVGLYDPKMLKVARWASLLKTRPILGTYRREPRSLPFRALGSVVSHYAEATARRNGQNRDTLSDALKHKLEPLFESDSRILQSLLDPTQFEWLSKAD